MISILELINTLNAFFSKPTFMQELLENSVNAKKFSEEIIMKKITAIFCYYLVTRDTSTTYTVDEIFTMYLNIKKKQVNELYYNNLITKGIVTHSFNGGKKELFEKYGADFLHEAPKEIVEKIQKFYKNFSYLEQISSSSPFSDDNEIEKLSSFPIYLTFPGAKSIYYAMKASPERLFMGPFGYITRDNTNMVLGESKPSYYYRLFTTKYSFDFRKSDKIEKIDDILIKIINTYCTKNPCIAFFMLEEMKDIISWFMAVKPYKEQWLSAALEDYSKEEPFKIRDFVTNMVCDEAESTYMHSIDKGNIVTLSEYLPSMDRLIISIPDMYEIKQTYARFCDYSLGESFDDIALISSGYINEEALIKDESFSRRRTNGKYQVI